MSDVIKSVRNVTWDDVIISQFDSNLVTRGNKEIASRLVSVGNCVITKISLDDLRNFISRVGIAMRTSIKKGRMSKLEICNVIVDAKLNPRLRSVVTETPSVVIAPKMNRKRLINVLFCDMIRPLLATLG